MGNARVLNGGTSNEPNIFDFTYTGDYEFQSDITGNSLLKLKTSGTLTIHSIAPTNCGFDIALIGGGGNGGSSSRLNYYGTGGGGGGLTYVANEVLQFNQGIAVTIGGAGGNTTVANFVAGGGGTGNPANSGTTAGGAGGVGNKGTGGAGGRGGSAGTGGTLQTSISDWFTTQGFCAGGGSGTSSSSGGADGGSSLAGRGGNYSADGGNAAANSGCGGGGSGEQRNGGAGGSGCVFIFKTPTSNTKTLARNIEQPLPVKVSGTVTTITQSTT